jgi:hypothetical protein
MPAILDNPQESERPVQKAEALRYDREGARDEIREKVRAVINRWEESPS